MNAHFETLAEKRTFKEAFEARRCLIPASGYYEWRDFEGRKQPVLFLLDDERTFFFAGLIGEATGHRRPAGSSRWCGP